MVMRKDTFGMVLADKRIDETENIRAVGEMEMYGSALEEDRSCGGKIRHNVKA